MIGVIANALAIVVGSIIGLLFRKGIPERVSNAVMQVMGAYVLALGIMGIFKSENSLVMLVALAIGTICGEALRIEDGVDKMGASLEKKFSSGGGFAQGFITGSLLTCIGAMSIVGSIEAGTVGDPSTLFAKSVIDLVAGVMLTATLGAGIMGASLSILVFEGGIVLLAGVIAPVLTDSMIAEMCAVGSILMMLMGLNLMGITKMKVANMVPAVLFAPFLSVLFSAIGLG